MSEQPDWRWCRKCQGLFFAGNPDQGVCPADQHAHDPSQSGYYAVFFDDVSLPTQRGWLPTQRGWRWCRKCQGLFFAGGATQGVCPVGTTLLVESPHDGTQSAHYAVFVGDGFSLPSPNWPPQIGQAGWKWCHNCQSMFFAGNPSQGACPAAPAAEPATDDHAAGDIIPVIAGPHDGSRSEPYTMPWDVVA
jgi:hypothetical protein